ncbi:MAG: hypothetical protein RLZZ172_725 [Bacteroidota bacterium]|jgi:hypothetical protein
MQVHAGGFLKIRLMIAKPTLHKNSSQYIYEITAWIRLIEFFNQENIHMKNRLSVVIEGIYNKEHVAMAEHFQNQFIVKDDVYDHMLHDLNKQVTKWQQNTICPPILNDLKKSHANLCRQIESLEKEQAVTRKDYNTYLSSLG